MLVTSKVELRYILPEALDPRFNDLGFIIVSACQDGYVNSEQFKENKTQIEDLKASIQLSKYASVCVWAEYEKDGESTRHHESEPSFIVFNSKSLKYKESSKRQKASLELKQLGESWCKMFDQEGYYYKEEGPSEEGQYIDGTGKVLQSFDEYMPLQAADRYFDLRNKSADKSSGLSYVKGALWLARPDWGSCDRVMRHGEIFID